MKKILAKLALVLIISVLVSTVTGCGITNMITGNDDGHTHHTHKYVEEVTKAPTCTEKGVKTFTCSCEDSYTEEIDMIPHTAVVDPAVKPGCETTGLTEGKHCSVCNEVIVAQEIVAARGHDYGEAVITEPTCNEKGFKTFTCKNDPNHIHVEEIDALGHADENKDHICDNGCDEAQGTHVEKENSHVCEYCGQTAGECRDGNNDHNCDVCGEKLSECVAGENSHNCATCGATLSEHIGGTATCEAKKVCTICGESYGELASHKGGAPVIENSTAASCGEAGSYDSVVYCSICGDELNRTTHTVDALPHDYKETITKAPTCEEAGSKTLTCSACGHSYTETIAALGHSNISYEAKAPTCTSIGWEAYVECSRCDYTTYKELPKASHNYDAVVTPPDCLNGGYTTFTCTGCGTSYTGNETVALGHTEKAVVTLPDCENGGYTTYTCENCGETRTGNETAALGHTEETVAGTPATCLSAGISDGKKCSVCQKTLVAQEEIPATGHDYDVVVDEATCTEAGLKTFTCKHCSDTYTEVINPTGSHSFTNGYVCDNCGFDSTEFRLENGGFENGLEGWTVVGNIGGVSSDRTYWVEAIEFGMDGDKMFSAYAPGALESAVGTLTSSTFVVGGSGFVTFKVGAMRDENYVYVDVVDAETKQILARYYNAMWTDADLSGCKLVAYKADLSAFMGKEVFFRLSDNADSGYGLFFADSFVTYYDNEPEGFNPATPVSYALPGTIYDIFNGSFEMGNVQGWWNNGEIGVVTNANGYWGDNIPYEKVGDFLFTGVESFGADTMREGNKGSLTSSAFVLGGTGWISFKLGGGGHEMCYVQVIDAVTGEVLAKYHQQAQRDAILIQYVADLSAHIGKTVRIQVIDQAENGWGCVSFDHVVTYYPEGVALPEGILANDIKVVPNYTIENGSFENGLDGWHMNIWEAGAHNTLGWVESAEHDAGWYTKNDDRKDGNNLFTFCKPDGTNCENTKGELVSSTFTLKKDSFVSFRFGGAGTREVRIELVKADGTVIARFYNEAPGKMNTEMFAYFYQYTGETTECFFRVVDDSVSNYGCFVVDDFRVNLESAPEGFIAAIQ